MLCALNHPRVQYCCMCRNGINNNTYECKSGTRTHNTINYVFVITRVRVPYGRYCQYLLYELLATGLFLYCVSRKGSRLSLANELTDLGLLDFKTEPKTDLGKCELPIYMSNYILLASMLRHSYDRPH